MDQQQQTITSIVFIDASVADLEALIAGYGPDTAVYVLDPGADGVLEMARIASAYSGLSSIHVLSHGGSGSLNVGTAVLDASTLEAYRDALATIGAALAETGDLLLYGCDVAAGEDGRAFLEALALATSADIAASTDLTGSTVLGGDWTLEAATGSIETAGLSADDYGGLLYTYRYGTNGADYIYGNSNIFDVNDVIYAYEGNDYVYAYSGNDYLYGHGGYDSLYGADGNDYLWGGNDGDILDGGSGIDTMYGSAGDDTYYIDSLSDYVYEYANEGYDWVYTGNVSGYTLPSDVEALYVYASSGTYYGYGNELGNTLYGGNANNYFSGGSGNDYLYGGSGNDSLYGGTENDTLDGGPGIDVLNAGDGSDIYYVDDPSDDAAEYWNDALGGVDTVYSYAYYFTIGFGIEHLYLSGNASYGYQYGYGNENPNLITGYAGSQTDVMYGYDGNDTLNGGNGGSGADYMYAGDGNDYYYVDNVSDYLYEYVGEGNDTVSSSIGFSLDSDVESLILTGTGNNYGYGNALNNILTGNDGANYLWGGAGVDQMAGGLGNDTLDVDSLSDTVVENAGGGTDWVYSSVSFSIASLANIENLYIYGAATTATGNASANTLWGSSNAETLNGGAGADNMEGGGGGDVYYVDNVGDTIVESAFAGAQSSADLVYSSVSYTLATNVENLTLTGTAVNATGNASANLLTGNASANILTGGVGADTMVGDLGNDTYGVDNALDVVTESSTVGGSDTIQVQAAIAYAMTANVENLVVTTTGGVAATGNASNNSITGNIGNDTLDGGGGLDTLVGGAGNDVYRLDQTTDVVNETAAGSAGDDTVEISVTGYVLGSNVENLTLIGTGTISGTGNTLANRLTGNSADNTLTGGVGNDSVSGGGGLDTYNLSGNQADYTVVELVGDPIYSYRVTDNDTADGVNDGIDYLTGVEWLRFLGDAASGTNPRKLIEDKVYLGDLVTPGSNDSIIAGYGDDTVDGKQGADTMVGLDGHDNFYIDNLGDSVVEKVGEGSDTVYASVNDTLDANIEFGYLAGTATSLTGSATANTLYGNSLSNLLAGGDGNDTLYGDTLTSGSDGVADTLRGGAGDDLYYVKDATSAEFVDETFAGSAGTDTVRSSLTSYTLTTGVEKLELVGSTAVTTYGYGNTLANTLIGNDGVNVLVGNGGADTMTGGLGSDTYYVDLATDVVIEGTSGGTALGAGNDTVYSLAPTYTLAVNVERLTLYGTGNIAGTGNILANTLTGNTGNNTLDGGTGNDTMAGGAGNDTYILDNALDVVNETVVGSAGIDTIQATFALDLTLAGFANIENLGLLGTAALAGTGDEQANRIAGNSGANTLLGNAGDDTILGGLGNDTMTGGIGNDTLSGGSGTDQANYGGKAKDYLIKVDADGVVTIQDLNAGDAGDDGTDQLDRVNVIKFGDGITYSLEAGVVSDSEQHVGASESDYNTTPEITQLAGGGFVVSWEQDYTIYAQRYGAFGSAVGGTITVTNIANSEYTYYGDVTALADGSFLVAHLGYQTSDGYRLRGERYDANGGLLTTTSPISLTTAADWVYEHSVASLSAGGYVATWSAWVENGSTGTYSYDVKVGLFDSPTDTTVTEIAIASGSNYQYGSAVAGLAGGGFVVAWYDGNLSPKGILAQRYTAAGVKVDASPFRIDMGVAGQNALYTPSVSALSDGGFMAYWQANAGTDYDIYGRRFGADGLAVGSAFTVNTTTAYSQETPSAATLADGGLVVVWASQQGGTDSLDIFGQRYDAAGAKVGAEFLVNSFVEGTQRSPDVVANSDGGFVVVWASEGDHSGVYMQRFNSDGGKIGGMQLSGSTGADVISLADSEQAVQLFGIGGADVLTGTGKNDVVDGGDGNDTLDGAVGADTMVGGAGDDRFEVDSADDVISENASQGTDTVYAKVNYVLPEVAVEKLVLLGSAASGTGNGFANTLQGNVQNNTLQGAGGNDTLRGGWGQDVAVYDEDMSAYVFGVNASGIVTVRHVQNSAIEGTDSLYNIESVKFGGASVDGPAVTVSRNAAFETQFQVGSPVDDYIFNPMTMSLAGGVTYTVWRSDNYNVNPAKYQMVGQGLAANGSAIDGTPADATGTAVGLSDNTSAYKSYEFALSGNASGGVVVWQENQYNPTTSLTTYTVKGRVVAADGTTGATVLTLVGPTTNSIYVKDVMFNDAGGGFSLATESYNGTSWVLGVQAYGATGVPSGSLASPSGLTYDGYEIEFIDSSSYVVFGENVSGYPYAQVFSIAGIALGSALQLATNYGYGFQATRLTEDSFVLSWNAYDGSGYNPVFRVIDDQDNAGPLTPMASEVDYYPDAPDVAAFDDGSFVAVWSANASANGQADIYARVFNADGTPSGAQFLVNSLLDGGQYSPRVSTNADGSFQVFWESGSSIDGQYFDADGNRLTRNHALGTVNFTGTDGADTLQASDAVLGVVVSGLDGNDVLGGGTGVDTIFGGIGNDTLDGKAGKDSLVGGAGNDTYVYDGTIDSFVELSGQGLDRVLAKVDFTLDDSLVSIENIQLDTAAKAATGNKYANSITGNALGNDLNGRAGADTMTGLGGNDRYVVDNVLDVVVEAANAGNDTIESSVTFSLVDTDGAGASGGNVENLKLTGAGAINATGNAGNNILTGNAGANSLTGGAGDDTYYDVGANDTVVENDSVDGTGNPLYGVDTIVTSIAVTALAAGIERLELIGTGNVNATGNALNNYLLGNSANNSLTGVAGNDTLNGRSGVDSLAGGLGDDDYYVQGGDDVVTEAAGQGTDTVYATGSYTLATGVYVEKLVLDGDGADTAAGNELANELVGNASNNTLDGKAGIDSMSGGLGNDTYIVDNAGDDITENADEGVDTVKASVTFSLVDSGDVENLVLEGSALNGTGNGMDNTLTGNASANLLDGLEGADTMLGGLGNDIYVVDNAGDVVTEDTVAGSGIDTVRTSLLTYVLPVNVEKGELTGTTSLDLDGNALANTLTGNTLNNKLDGKAGADSMLGGKGDDFYYLDSLSDSVTELAGEGNDTVYFSSTVVATYTLTANVENLALQGSLDLNGTGNFLSNVIYGNAGKNIIDGGQFVDVLIGGLGDDTYKVDTADDLVIEDSVTGAGSDTILSTVSYILPGNVEKLTLVEGSGNTSATGNALNNTLIGNSGNNLLSGLGGNDTLIGNAGNDTLDGGLGSDSMSGGLGDDVYFVESAGDAVVEVATLTTGTAVENAASSGIDLVESSIDYTLLANTENLRLSGTAVNGTGNALNNQIIGNAANNVLKGLDGNDLLKGEVGADTMEGGLGNDIYYVDNNGDLVTESADQGTDVVYAILTATATTPYSLPTNVENVVYFDPNVLYIVGNDLNNYFTGNEGENTLDGAGGDDTMEGGAGNDLYIVGSAGDKVIENASEGTDTVKASVNYSIADSGDVENLVLDTGATEGTGNSLNNKLSGNTGNNVLDGGAGSDELDGGAGDDTYKVDSANDVIKETDGNGTDTVVTTANLDLSAVGALENVVLDGLDNLNVTANALDNLIVSNNGNNVINGGGGIDTASYQGATGSVNANLSAGQSTGSGGVDTLLNVENLEGGAYGDTLQGNDIGNVLDGSAGKDTMAGGAGSDVYYVDDVSDKVIENNNTPATGLPAGTDIGSIYPGVEDTVNATVSFTLTAYLENLIQSGSLNLTGVGNELRNKLSGNDGNNLLQGLAEIDTLIGGLGNDTLDGGTGNDSLTGGAGNDTYRVNSTLDLIIELAGGGTDLVETTVSYSLVDTDGGGTNGGNVENIRLTGSGAINATGNALANILYAGAGANILNGGAGVDTVSYLYATAAVTVSLASTLAQTTGGSGSDTLSLIENLTGSKYNDTLTGNTGNNILDGGLGNDKLTGGTGNDTYRVDSALDIVVELATGGTADIVETTVSFSLVDTDGTGSNGGNVENIRLTGSGAINATGNALANILYAGAGNNVLNGGAGVDTVSYLYATAAVTVSLATAALQATVGSGSDTLSLIENLTGGKYNDKLTGDGLANLLTGGLGADTLTGGLGADRFDFNAVDESGLTTTAQDVVADFVSGQGDKIDLSTIDANTITTGDQVFAAPTQGAAFSSTTTFTAAGQLFYDQTADVLYGNTDADAAAEFSIKLTNVASLVASDLIL